MLLSIVRHAIAVPRGTAGYPNDDRPLTDEGIEKMRSAAKGIVRLLDVPSVILTSPLSRARGTADIIADAFHRRNVVKETPHLLPGSPSAAVLDLLGSVHMSEGIMIVGHEPDLGNLTARLLGTRLGSIAFKKGGMACLDISSLSPQPTAHLRWFIPPRMLRLLGGH